MDTGEDNDTVHITDVSSGYRGQTTLGSGDDTLTILDNGSSSRDLYGTTGTFDGGSGNDTLNLPNITISQWNSYVSDIFTSFETVNLEDGTLNP